MLVRFMSHKRGYGCLPKPDHHDSQRGVRALMFQPGHPDKLVPLEFKRLRGVGKKPTRIMVKMDAAEA